MIPARKNKRFGNETHCKGGPLEEVGLVDWVDRVPVSIPFVQPVHSIHRIVGLTPAPPGKTQGGARQVAARRV